MAHILSPEAQLEINAWNGHRARHRGGPQPVAARRRLATAAHASIQKFARAMQVADKHRTILKRRYGFDDKQIGTLAVAALKRSRLTGVKKRG